MWTVGAWTTGHGRPAEASLSLQAGWFSCHDSINWTFVYQWFPNVSRGRLPKNHSERWFIKTKTDFWASPTDSPIQEVWDEAPASASEGLPVILTGSQIDHVWKGRAASRRGCWLVLCPCAPSCHWELWGRVSGQQKYNTSPVKTEPQWPQDFTSTQ